MESMVESERRQLQQLEAEASGTATDRGHSTGISLEALKKAQEEGRQRGQQERKRREQSGGIQEPGQMAGRAEPEQPQSGSLIRG